MYERLGVKDDALALGTIAVRVPLSRTLVLINLDDFGGREVRPQPCDLPSNTRHYSRHTSTALKLHRRALIPYLRAAEHPIDALAAKDTTMPPFGDETAADHDGDVASPASKPKAKKKSRSSPLRRILRKPPFSPSRKSKSAHGFLGGRNSDLDSVDTAHSAPATSFEKYSPAERANWAPIPWTLPAKEQQKVKRSATATPRKLDDFHPKKSALKPKGVNGNGNTCASLLDRASSFAKRNSNAIKVVAVMVAISLALIGAKSMMGLEDEAFEETKPAFDDEFLDLQLRVIEYQNGI